MGTTANRNLRYPEGSEDANTLDDAIKNLANDADRELQELEAGKAAADHNHDGRYYQQYQVDEFLDLKANDNHTHDSRYYTESEVDQALLTKAAANHNHNLRHLADVIETNLSNGDSLRWNEAEQKWRPIPNAIVNLSDVVTEDLADGSILRWSDAEGAYITTPFPASAGGATTLDQLTDVATPAPGDGYVLTWDASTSQWVAMPGGGAVGSWENDKLVTFSSGAMSEITGSPLFALSGATMPGSPQHTITVTSGMLASANRDVGFIQALEVVFLFDAAGMTGATSTTLVGEAYIGAESTGNVNTTISTTATARAAVTFVIRDVQVGETINFRFRLNGATHAGVNCVARGATCYPLLILKGQPPAGGRYIYRDLVTTGLLTAPLITSQGGVHLLQNWRYYDNDIIDSTATTNIPEVYRPTATWMPGPNYGLYASSVYHSTSTRLTGHASTTAAGSTWSISHLRTPQSIRYDRLAVPALP